MKKLALFVLGMVFIVVSSVAQKPKYNSDKGLVLKGYDLVSYFQDGPEKGKKKFQTKFEGHTFYFKSEENKKLFEKMPSKYLPEYGGWCAFAMGDYGEKVIVNPQTYELKDGKLYLFYHNTFINTLKKWEADRDMLQPEADINWKKFEAEHKANM